MKTVYVLFDSLNLRALSCYREAPIQTPNFDRFSQRAMTFDNHYVGSLPCMPARRDLHTGRLNFMHRSWGPLEPFDNSMPQILSSHGIYTHLISDHFHYFEDGGTGYHTRYNTWEFIRGQEYDAWKAMVEPPIDRFKEMYSDRHYNDENSIRLQHQINNEFINDEADFPAAKCFESAFQFLDTNRSADNWMLHLECFDPHEPFKAPKRFKDALKSDYKGPILDWPKYGKVHENPEEIVEIRRNYACLVAMCDEYFGRLLDYFDEHEMWEDTCLILTTDHGFLLSEHDWWGKNLMPYYDEISHIPLIIYNPSMPEKAGTRHSVLTQTADLMPTILDVFEVPIPKEVTAKSIFGVLKGAPQHTSVTYGMFGGPIGVNNGEYSLFIYPPNLSSEELGEYTLMPNHLDGPFSGEELATSQLKEPFDFTKGQKILRVNALNSARRPGAHDSISSIHFETSLYHNLSDPKQLNAIDDPDIVSQLRGEVLSTLEKHEAPEDYYSWMGFR